VAILGVALVSPIHELGERFLQVHMLQHALLTVVAPPLLWLGWPFVPILLGLPRSLAHLLGHILAFAWMKWIRRALGHPLFAWLAFAAVMWGWHLPAAYELALRSEAWHYVEHASFLAAALLFWRIVVAPWPSALVWPRWSMIPYLALADVQNTALCALLTFSDRVWYKPYALLPRPLGVSPLEDQATAGAIMWILGSAVILTAGGCIVRELLAPERGESWPREPIAEDVYLGGSTETRSLSWRKADAH
jgi:cytochrome c oxidase assembly factor CtaG